jgi:hypothetical protein
VEFDPAGPCGVGVGVGGRFFMLDRIEIVLVLVLLHCGFGVLKGDVGIGRGV